MVQKVGRVTCGASHLSFNANNQLASTPYQYDAAGNLTNDGIHTYTYDAENRIIAVDGGATATYLYDDQGFRVRSVAGGVTTEFLHDLSGNVVTELQAGTFARGYTYFNGRLLSQYVNGQTFFTHLDHLGSTRMVTTYSTTAGLNGQVSESLDFQPFGERAASSTANFLLDGSAFDQAPPWVNWDAGAATITANATTAPDGSSTADKLAFPAVTSRRVQDFLPNVISGGGQQFTYSVWLRADSNTTAYLSLEDRTGSSNYLMQGWALDQSTWANWDSGVPTITSDATTAPDGSTTATKIAFPSAQSRRVDDFAANAPNIQGQSFTFSVWLRADSNTSAWIAIEDKIASPLSYTHTSSVVSVTTSWQNFTVTRTTRTGISDVYAEIGNLISPTQAVTIYAWGAEVTGPITYQNTSTTASVTTSWQQFTVTRTLRTGISNAYAEIGNNDNPSVARTVYAWGAQVTGAAVSSSDLTHKFTGQERDSETGDDNFGARYFGSGMGRFLSPDPGPWIFTNPQSYNSYAYGLNNPLRYVDATGETAEDRVNMANQLAAQNIPYVNGGGHPGNPNYLCGLDCSGLLFKVFSSDPDNLLFVGGSAQQEANQLMAGGQFSTNINNAQPGDAIFFSDPNTGKIKHAGIVVDIKNGKIYFVHAPQIGETVHRTWIDMKTLLFGKNPVERFAGVGRPIENITQPNAPNPTNNSFFSTLVDGFGNFLEELFFNQDFNPPLSAPSPVPPGEVCSQLGDQSLGCQ